MVVVIIPIDTGVVAAEVLAIVVVPSIHAGLGLNNTAFSNCGSVIKCAQNS